MTAHPQPVAVTGLAAMTGLGNDLATTWAGLLDGRNPVARFTLFDPEGLPCTFGVQLPPGAEEHFARRIHRRHRAMMTRGTMIAATTAQAALEDAALPPGLDLKRAGVVAGATGCGYVSPREGPDEHRILRNMASAPAAWISLRSGFAGPSLVASTACSSGAYALGMAQALIADGRCDVVLAGAADSSLNADDVRGFCDLLALSERNGEPQRVCCPFDRRRSGFVLGEGGGFLVLESLTFARARGARIRALMPPPGLCSESYNILSPRPGGGGMAEAMRLALDLAGLEPKDIGYVNAHGTSTPLNDACEVEAVRSVFGEAARTVPISSTKAATGHCLAGAAGVEAVLCCKALEEGVAPFTLNLTEPDDGFDLAFVRDRPRRLELRHVMSNSFAFGGQNGVNVFSRPP